MKARSLLFFFFCCLSYLAIAQTVDKPDRMRFGVKGGVHLSNMHYSNLDLYNSDWSTNGVGGIFAEFDLGEKRKFTIRPEILFLSRGTEIKDDNIFYKLKAKYTDFRVPIIYNFSNPSKVSPYIFVAPVVGIARGGEINYTEYYDGEAYDWTPLDISDANLSKMNFSVAAGFGVRIPMKITAGKRIYLALEANYQYGITDNYGSKEKNGEAIAVNRAIYDITGTRRHQGIEVTAALSVPLSIFKKAPKKEKPVPIVETPVVVEKTPVAPVVVEKEKPCYTLEEILDLVVAQKPITGKTICAIDVINFEFGKSSINKDSYAYLDKIVMLMKRTNLSIEIKGHTDNVGKADFNLELSKKRAKSVYDYLIKKGVNSSKLSYTYYGMAKPIASNDTEEGRLINRRVEFEIK